MYKYTYKYMYKYTYKYMGMTAKAAAPAEGARFSPKGTKFPQGKSERPNTLNV